MTSSSFAAVKLSDRVYWVGARDVAIRDFHGYSTNRGSTYNAYLILGTKPILIDTVKAPFFNEMVARIKSVIDPQKIAYIISNHAEMDHSGSLLAATALIKPEKIFTSTMGKVALEAHFHEDLALTEITDQETFSLGDATFKCIETRMLHWPDSMCTYLVNDKILFSQDGFGMHYACSQVFADQNRPEILEYEAKKYFANILLPYAKFVTRFLQVLPTLKLDINLLAPDHGPIWRTPESINWIIEHWEAWASQIATKKAVVCYDTMWGSTAKMAASIADGLNQKQVTTELLPLSGNHRSDIVTSLIDAGAFIIGSPTLNNQIFPTVADLLCYLEGLKVQNLCGQAFGSFGWSGEAPIKLKASLERMGVTLIGEPLKQRYVPSETDLQACVNFGSQFATEFLAKFGA